jgi:hypothetical protein
MPRNMSLRVTELMMTILRVSQGTIFYEQLPRLTDDDLSCMGPGSTNKYTNAFVFDFLSAS